MQNLGGLTGTDEFVRVTAAIDGGQHGEFRLLVGGGESLDVVEPEPLAAGLVGEGVGETGGRAVVVPEVDGAAPRPRVYGDPGTVEGDPAAEGSSAHDDHPPALCCLKA